MRDNHHNFLISAMTGTLLAVLFRYMAFKHPQSPIGIETLGNIKAYLILAFLWLGVFFGMDLLLEKVLKRDIPKRPAYILAAV